MVARAGDDKASERQATLIRKVHRDRDDTLKGRIQIGIFQEDCGGLTPKLQANTLQTFPSDGSNMTARQHAACEADLVDAPMSNQIITRFATRRYNHQHARRQADRRGALSQ